MHGNDDSYLTRAQRCIDLLMEHGTDRYGEGHAPVLVTILNVDTRTCPEVPEKLDEYFRVTRRGRRSPGGSNLLSDQPTLKTMYALSHITGKSDYADFADRYAGKYGRAISFFLHLYVVTGERRHLDDARALADESIEKLYHKGLFRGHPAKPYYEAMDGVGNLLYALLELDQILKDPQTAVNTKVILIGTGKRTLALDNW